MTVLNHSSNIGNNSNYRKDTAMKVKDISHQITKWYKDKGSKVNLKKKTSNIKKLSVDFSDKLLGTEIGVFMNKHKGIMFAIIFTLLAIVYGIIINTIHGNTLYTLLFVTMLVSIIIITAIGRIFIIIDRNDKRKEQEALEKKKWREQKRLEGEMVMQKHGFTKPPSEKRPMRRKKKTAV